MAVSKVNSRRRPNSSSFLPDFRPASTRRASATTRRITISFINSSSSSALRPHHLPAPTSPSTFRIRSPTRRRVSDTRDRLETAAALRRPTRRARTAADTAVIVWKAVTTIPEHIRLAWKPPDTARRWRPIRAITARSRLVFTSMLKKPLLALSLLTSPGWDENSGDISALLTSP